MKITASMKINYGLLRALLLVGMTLYAADRACADDPTDPNAHVIAESHGPVPPATCDMSNCGTILTIRHRFGLESVTSEDGPGVYLGTEVGTSLGYDGYLPDPMYPVDPLDPYDDDYDPMLTEESSLQKESELWDIDVQMQDGTTQTIEQDFQPLLRPGARVLVEGNSVRLAD